MEVRRPPERMVFERNVDVRGTEGRQSDDRMYSLHDKDSEYPRRMQVQRVWRYGGMEIRMMWMVLCLINMNTRQ
jgi:hypothetical protein